MAECKSRVAEKISATLDRAGFETPSSGSFRIEETDTFQRKLGECRPVQESVGDQDDIRYQIRIARRLFEDDRDSDWRDVVVDAEYILACPNGCSERGYLKRSKRIKFPWKYACPECETRLVSYDAADIPAVLEPGTCCIASIPWTRREDRTTPETSQAAAYLLACPNGCFEIGYVQHREETRRPGQYRCGECESQTISYPADQRPTDPTPGTNYTDRRND